MQYMSGRMVNAPARNSIAKYITLPALDLVYLRYWGTAFLNFAIIVPPYLSLLPTRFKRAPMPNLKASTIKNRKIESAEA